MLRKVLAAFAGISCAVVLFIASEHISHLVSPLPVDLDPADHEAKGKWVQGLPAAALLIIVGGWIIGSLCCGLLIRIVSRSNDRSPAYIAGLFLMTAGIVDIFMYTYPLWFIISGILVFIPMTLLGHSLIKK